MPILVLTVVLTMLAVLPFSLQAESSKCDTPVGCYEEAITNYKEAIAKLKTTQTDLEKARKEVDDTLAQLKDQKLGDKIAKLEQQQEFKSFKVEGDINKFYPIIFVDDDWHINPLELEITRPETHTDSNGRGSLVSKITFHSDDWGNGSSFLYADIHQTTRFIADYADYMFAPKLIVWLKGGGTTYRWHANHPVTLLDYTAVDQKIIMISEDYNTKYPDTRVTYESKTQVRPDLDKNNVYPLGDRIAKLEQQQELKSFKVEGDINKFYPIVFLDVAWDIDPLELEINRINIHQDSQWRGSLVSKITYHANGWGNGSSFLYAEIHQTTRFIADYADHGFAAKLIVWLRGGGTTYQWHANHPATLLDYTAVDNKIVMVNDDPETIKLFPHTRIAYESKTQVRADLDKNNVYPWDKQ